VMNVNCEGVISEIVMLLKILNPGPALRSLPTSKEVIFLQDVIPNPQPRALGAGVRNLIKLKKRLNLRFAICDLNSPVPDIKIKKACRKLFRQAQK